MLRRAEAAAQVMGHLIDHDAHGYTQGAGREGNGTLETLTLTSGERAIIEGGDADCSESVRRSWAAVGVLPWGYWASYMWTGNERRILLAHGFQEIRVQDAGAMKRGDVLLKDGHTELYLGHGLQGGARINEKGTILGGKEGDQTGGEIARGPYNRYQWRAAFRYIGPERNGQVSGQPVNSAGVTYRAHVAELGWLDPVRDGQTAGTTDESRRLEAFKLTLPKGWTVDAVAHIQDVGDVSFPGITRGESSGTGSTGNDPIIGTTGKSKRLEGFSLTPTEQPEGRQLRYRVHIQDMGWQAWRKAGEFAGTRGQSKRLEALQIVIV